MAAIYRGYRILVLPGDGIGPEIVSAAISVMTRATTLHGVTVSFEYDDVGQDSLKKYGTTLRDSVLERARTFDGIVLGTQSHADYPPPDKGGRNVSAGFRVGMDLFANSRPVKTYAGVPTHMRAGKSMDLVIMREATEGFYPDRNMARGWGEMMPSADMALSFRKITRQACERIAQKAFELAHERRKIVTAIHKANSFHMSDGLFLEAARSVAAKYPDVVFNDLLVDAAAAHLVRDPQQFDVILTTNLYGDILSDLASELSGGLGLGGAVMMNDQYCCAQAQHGSAPTIAGKDIANPTSMILSASMLLRWIGRSRKDASAVAAANAMAAAVEATLERPELHTHDLGGTLSCRAFARAVEHALSPVNKL
eukprot:m.11959 g.11959  ORF g.11959 m.11959 type:complete len:368 (-) comp2681_c0_seq1:149-1252(-)